MKRLAKCAVLLAFALAFAGCSNDDGLSLGGGGEGKNLQEALNAGGTVNLDECDFSGSQTYTIGKTTVITGDAKGAKFVINNGVDVTFDGTKGIGTLSVGSSASAAKSALAARAAAGGAKVTLRNGVEAKNVYIYVVCTFSAEDSDSTFVNVVIAEGVASVTLSGTAKVTNLVARGEGEITINVDGSVKITNANGKAKEAVKESNSTVGGNIGEIDDEILKGLESEFENASKDDGDDASKDDGKIISTKYDLTEAVKGIIKAYYEFAKKVDNGNPSRAAATTKDEVAGQLKNVFDVIYEPFKDEDLGKSIVKLFLGEGASKDVNLKGEINLANIKPSVGVDAYIDFINHANDTRGEGNNSYTSYTKETYFGDNYKTVMDFLGVADKYASIPELYVLGEFIVNKDNLQNYASGKAQLKAAVEVTNINALIPELFKVYNDNIGNISVPASANLPVTAVKPFVNVDAKVDLLKTDYDALVKVFEDMPGWGDEPVWDFNEPMPTYPSYDDYFDTNGNHDDDAWDKACNEYWQAYDEYLQKYYAYEAEWDVKYDAYVAKHREELANHFKNATYSGSYSGKINAGVSTTVTSSADIPGGIIKLSLDASYSSPAKILAFLFWFDGLDDVDDYAAFLRELKNDYDIIPTVTVTDYDGKQTLKLEIDDIISVIDSVVDSIGEIIQ